MGFWGSNAASVHVTLEPASFSLHVMALSPEHGRVSGKYFISDTMLNSVQSSCLGRFVERMSE